MAPERVIPAEQEHRWTLLDLWRVLRKQWWLLLSLSLAGAAAAAFHSMGSTKIYLATTTIQIDPAPPKPLGQEVQNVVEVGAGSYANNLEYYRTQYDILTSRSLTMKTVKRLALHRDTSFLANQPSSAPLPGAFTERAFTEDDARAALGKRLSVIPKRDSRLVQISFEDADPERAKRVLRTLIEIYIDDNVDGALASSNIAAQWLDEQLQKLKGELSDNELSLYSYKRDNQILSVSLDDQGNMLRDEMQHLNQALTRVRTELETLQSRVDQLKHVDVTDPLDVPVQELLGSSVLSAMRADYVRARQRLRELVEGGKGDRHPEVLAAGSTVEISRTALLAEVNNIQQALGRDLAAKRQESEGLGKLFGRAKDRAQDLNRLGLEYKRLERAKNNTEKVYSLVLERAKESDLTRYMRFNNIRVIDDAFVSGRPIKPSTSFNVAMGSMLGLVFGLFAAFGRNALDRTFQSTKDLEEQLGLPLLGALPKSGGAGGRIRSTRSDDGAQELVVHQTPHSNAAEAARALRTNLMFASPDKPPKILVVTSGGPFEGKTTVACWVATAIAQAGQRVLLLDCDLRRPRLHKIFKRRNDTGISVVVMEEAKLEECVVTTEIPNLSLLTAGPSVPNPAELLQSDRFAQFLKRLASEYDRIVIDSPPVNAVTDAAILSTRTDGTLLVVRAHTTSRDAARHSVRTLRDVSPNLLGVVLNAFDEKRGGYYGYRGYSYGYPSYGPDPGPERVTRRPT